MIHRYSTQNMNRWNQGDFQVQLLVVGQRLPMGFCDGSEEDEQEIRLLAEEEGVEDLAIHKKHLWTGREIWTLGEERPPEEDEEF